MTWDFSLSALIEKSPLLGRVRSLVSQLEPTVSTLRGGFFLEKGDTGLKRRRSFSSRQWKRVWPEEINLMKGDRNMAQKNGNSLEHVKVLFKGDISDVGRTELRLDPAVEPTDLVERVAMGVHASVDYSLEFSAGNTWSFIKGNKNLISLYREHMKALVDKVKGELSGETLSDFVLMASRSILTAMIAGHEFGYVQGWDEGVADNKGIKSPEPTEAQIEVA
jgi:hypothetical protein